MDEEQAPNAKIDVGGMPFAANRGDAAAGPQDAGAGHLSRPTLDREEHEITDDVLRMGSLVEG